MMVMVVVVIMMMVIVMVVMMVVVVMVMVVFGNYHRLFFCDGGVGGAFILGRLQDVDFINRRRSRRLRAAEEGERRGAAEQAD